MGDSENNNPISIRKRPIIIFDGLNCFIRFFMANESINSYSEPVGGVVGFLKFLDFMIYRFAPGRVIVVWENGGPSPRRRGIYSGYKQGRSKFLKDIKASSQDASNQLGESKKPSTMKEELKADTQNKIKQLGLLYKILNKTPICQIFIKETECDDIIGYLTKYQFATENRLKLIVSSDKDFYQLLKDPDIKIYDPAKKITLNENYLLTNFGISSNNFCLAKALHGDPSDDLEGVPGVGFKTLAKRLPAMADRETDMTIDGLLEACRQLNGTLKKPLKTIQEIVDNEELIRRNWKLMYLTSSNLSAHQIEKINGTIEENKNSAAFDRLGLLKEVSKARLNMVFNFDKFSSNIRQFLIFD